MTIRILIITHDEVGQALLMAAKTTFGELPLPTEVIQISRTVNPEQMIQQIQQTLSQLQANEGVLILTDIFGSTPSNIAQAIHNHPNTRLVTGLNLPMLIRIMNYPTLDLNTLVAKAVSGGREGIIDCQQEKI
jgi:PTS system ascorbate-specific IIA component